MKRWVQDLYRLAMRLGENEVPQLVEELERLNDNLEALIATLNDGDPPDGVSPAEQADSEE